MGKKLVGLLLPAMVYFNNFAIYILIWLLYGICNPPKKGQNSFLIPFLSKTKEMTHLSAVSPGAKKVFDGGFSIMFCVRFALHFQAWVSPGQEDYHSIYTNQ